MGRLVFFLVGLLLGAPASAETAQIRGERVFKKCKSCHQIGAEAKNRVGPNLNAVIGREAGSVEAFRYSKALRQAASEGLVWTEDTLDAYLENPRRFLKGTRMSFRGLKKPKDRANLIAFLAGFRHADAPAKTNDPDVDPAILALQGDPDYGEYLSGECVTCHEKNGASEGIPSIHGMPDAAFVTALHAYRGKHRDNATMQMIAGRLSDEEIAGLAAYFGAQK